LRTAIDTSNTIGKAGVSAWGETGVSFSGADSRVAK
jgi:hypothetical protein